MARLAVTQRMTYEQYIASTVWRAKREHQLRADKHRCQGCGADSDLHVHHRTYERLGCERPGDLVTVCHLCHTFIHQERARLGGSLGVVTDTALALIRAAGRVHEKVPERQHEPRRAEWREDARGGGTWGRKARQQDASTSARRVNGLA